MKKRILTAAIGLLLIAAAVCALQIFRAEGSDGILYRVTGDRGTAYVLGSIHIGTPEMHPFGNALEEAMAEADTFVFECDTSSDTSLARLSERQTLPAGTTLRDVLGGTLTDDIVSAYKALHLSTENLESRKPWAVINTLAVYSSAAEMGAKNARSAVSLGVETAVLAYANAHGKQFAYLETIDEIADTMESFSSSLNRYLLSEEIGVVLGRKPQSDGTGVAQWPAWWRDGNAAAFEDFYRQSFLDADAALYAEYQDKLVTRRNALMAGRLDAMLQTGGTYFVTVGLLHLVPEDASILSLLREMGYTVEKVMP